MAGIGICKNENCIKKEECYRFQCQDGEVVEFKNICLEGEYKYYWQINKEVDENV